MTDKRNGLKFPCLVLDHDDTTVNSTATVHYPCFVEYMEKFFPSVHLTLEEYFNANFDPGVVALFTEICGMTEEQMMDEERYWAAYCRTHSAKAYPGIREILEEQRRRGGRFCVVSHSFTENILRDYRENGLPEPDMVFGWEYPPEQRKPSPWPLQKIMAQYGYEPEELLVVDDLKPGYDMARAAGVPFAAAGWANDIEKIESYMRKHCDRYYKTVQALWKDLFEQT